VVQHNRPDLDSAIAQIRLAFEQHQIRDSVVAIERTGRYQAVRHKGGQSLVNPSCSICRTWPSVTPNRSATSLIDRGTVIPWSWAPTSASKICLRWSSKSRFSK
jgi:hypothetical protein